MPRLIASRCVPTRFPRRVKGIVAEANLRVIDRSRLRFKVVVFDSTRNLRTFWKRYFGNDLGRSCIGAVQAFVSEVNRVNADDSLTCVKIIVPRGFFAIVGLVAEHCTMRVISHECVHVGYAYAKRKGKSWWADAIKEHDEEAVAYPAGEAACQIVGFLDRSGVISRGNKPKATRRGVTARPGRGRIRE